MSIQLQLDRKSTIPLQDQLFDQLRRMILNGTLKPNSRVIATRFLAEQIGVSRTTVLLAYERLISEGYLETRPAIGTFVAATLPATQLHPPSSEAPLGTPRQACIRPVIFHPPTSLLAQAEDGFIDFSPRRFETAQLLPPKLWLKGIRNVFESGAASFANVPPPAGILALRRAIADHVAATRGIVATSEQVIVVDGRLQACNFVAHLFQRRGDRVMLECPCEEHVAAFFAARGAELSPVPVDEDGLKTDLLPEGPASLGYVTPARQNPLGGTMPLSRRKALIEWARDVGSYIIEDDSDGELRYYGTQPPPLIALDPYGLTFFVGSFAKTLGAGLGLGYLIVPPEFVDSVLAIKTFAEGGRQWLEQMVIADLLQSGQYDHHLRRLRKQNLERRDALISSLQTVFDGVHLIGTDVGIQLSWVLPEQFLEVSALCEHARARGVILKGVSSGFLPDSIHRGLHERTVLFEYANVPTEQIRQAIIRLGDGVST